MTTLETRRDPWDQPSAPGRASVRRQGSTPYGVDLGRRARTDSLVRQCAMASLWLSLLLVTYWWVADGGVGTLSSWAEVLVALGRLTGLWASVLLMAQVLLMARVPALEKAFGQDRLAHVHRVVGFTSFNLMLAHLVTISWGYAAGSLTSTPSTLWDMVLHYPGMLLATAGTLALVMVVVTSIKAARKKVRYESWHLIHLYAYLGVGLALPHQLWTGQQFLSSWSRTVFWWTAWILTVFAVLAYRVGLPVYRNLRHGLRVKKVVREAPGIVSVHVTGRHLDELPVEAGQFFSWRFLGRPGWTRSNPYSLSAAPDGRSLRITVQVDGDGSRSILSLTKGSRVLVEGPYGRLSPRARTRRKVALIAAGVGVTPVRALAEGLDYGPGDAVVLHRFSEAPLFAAEFGELVRDRGLQVLNLPGRRRAQGSWLGPGSGSGSDLAALRHWVPDIADRDVYVCGPEVWTDLVRATLTAAGLPVEQLHLETFAW